MDDVIADEEQAYQELQRRADRICSLIVASDYPAVDVAIETRQLREFAGQHFPGRSGLFRRIYESRFRRLWEQFRPEAAGPLTLW
jgi:hypothetical protein